MGVCVVDVDLYRLFVLFGVDDLVIYVIYWVQGVLLYLLLVDYVGQQVLCVLIVFGLFQVELDCYIGWDIGIVGIICVLVKWFDVWVIEQIYLWLLIDCNCLLVLLMLILEVSDYIVILGNVGLLVVQWQQCIDVIYVFYYVCIEIEFDVCCDVGQLILLVMMYSFIFVMNGMQ